MTARALIAQIGEIELIAREYLTSREAVGTTRCPIPITQRLPMLMPFAPCKGSRTHFSTLELTAAAVEIWQ